MGDPDDDTQIRIPCLKCGDIMFLDDMGGHVRLTVTRDDTELANDLGENQARRLGKALVWWADRGKREQEEKR